MKKTVNDIAFGVERAYSAYTTHMANHLDRMKKFRENGYITQELRNDFEFDRDQPLSNFKEFVAALPDHDGDFQIDADGYNISISFSSRKVITDFAIDKLRAQAGSVILQFHHYLSASHVLYFMRNNNMEEIEEIHYNALYYAHQYQLLHSNVTPEGFNESFEVTQ